MEKINADKALRYQYLREKMAASDTTTTWNFCFREREKKGMEQGMERYSLLILKLTEDERLEEIIKADSATLQQLYQKYQI